MRNEDYQESIDGAIEEAVDQLAIEIDFTLSEIENQIDHESGRILLMWARDAIQRTVKNHMR